MTRNKTILRALMKTSCRRHSRDSTWVRYRNHCRDIYKLLTRQYQLIVDQPRATQHLFSDCILFFALSVLASPLREKRAPGAGGCGGELMERVKAVSLQYNISPNRGIRRSNPFRADGRYGGGAVLTGKDGTEKKKKKKPDGGSCAQKEGTSSPRFPVRRDRRNGGECSERAATAGR
ncbi:hypothetical protein F2P81_007817 [Scophthalmus maximus]|uniref:Uncharacterized protein n=1 Tax=Scophthalmus maximus TaxID=52904 RepID=A0A6A4TBJ3_SCOMX|nr:hypothetical protein F2P81_007817 [Scophthalmus maximus]